ncbi:hypothetical protein PsorP6_001624 [Peronosclerospora sorghi]|uniref:Uncharacterized protein n=1 Tax=Peronosclerospora sorghi TaxID=230839 RepID=A0ACC0WUB1_9STRA|nr:hypothetical protein PsorP6_001624 [Peronosclerospora sorghi]
MSTAAQHCIAIIPEDVHLAQFQHQVKEFLSMNHRLKGRIHILSTSNLAGPLGCQLSVQVIVQQHKQYVYEDALCSTKEICIFKEMSDVHLRCFLKILKSCCLKLNILHCLMCEIGESVVDELLGEMIDPRIVGTLGLHVVDGSRCYVTQALDLSCQSSNYEDSMNAKAGARSITLTVDGGSSSTSIEAYLSWPQQVTVHTQDKCSVIYVAANRTLDPGSRRLLPNASSFPSPSAAGGNGLHLICEPELVLFLWLLASLLAVVKRKCENLMQGRNLLHALVLLKVARVDRPPFYRRSVLIGSVNRSVDRRDLFTCALLPQCALSDDEHLIARLSLRKPTSFVHRNQQLRNPRRRDRVIE